MKKLIDYIYTHWDKTLRYTPEDDGVIVGLPYKFTSPSMSELHSALFYWDTYFTNEGLILSDKLDYAIDNVENIAYLINKYGFMPNGNRTYFLNRSQPPFFSLMVKQIYEITRDKAWLSRMYQTILTEWSFWQNQRMTDIGLNQYSHTLGDIETAEFLDESYLKRRIPFYNKKDRESVYKLNVFHNVVCESGWDCTSRIQIENSSYAWIDLNALLYGMERDMAYFADELGVDGAEWTERSERRGELIFNYLWNEERKMFCDYDLGNGRKSDLLTAAAYYPLFVGMADEKQARAMVEKLSLLDFEFGLSATEKRDDLLDFQWDYPVGWAPLHYIIIKGLENYGYHAEGVRIAEKYCKIVENAFEKTGDVWEKYNVLTGKPAACEGVEHPMMGWSAGTYLWCRKFADEG